MIIWLASYPKSGNTWVRLFLDYLFSSKKEFNINSAHIKQFPLREHFKDLTTNIEDVNELAKYYTIAQDKLNLDNEVKIFKTHNALVKIGQNDFTNQKNTLGGIYIVRDPRNVLDSMSRHFQINHDKALKVMQDENSFTYDFKKKNDYSDYQFISSWEKNYQSWKNNRLIPVKFLRYEDLLNETFFVFKEIVEFIDKLTNNKKGFSREKAKNSVKSTSFENLKKIEKINGFSESIISREEKKKIPFFHLGPKNNWQKNFDKKLANKLNNIFEKNLKELNY